MTENNLKVATMTYDKVEDFRLDRLMKQLQQLTSRHAQTDKHFKMTRAEVEDHKARIGIDPTTSNSQSIGRMASKGFVSP